MQFSNRKLFESLRTANTDDYGRTVVRFAEKWADLMESELAQDKSLAEIARTTSQQIGIEISGAQFSVALNTLSQTWKYGAGLRAAYDKGR